MVQRDKALRRGPDGETRSYMGRENFIDLMQHSLGFGWQSTLSNLSGISRSQINRYANGTKIPKYIALIVVLITAVKDAGMIIPPTEPFLPDPEEETPKKHTRRATGGGKASRKRPAKRKAVEADAPAFLQSGATPQSQCHAGLS